MTEKIRIGLIGAGYWGRNLARVFSQLDTAELVVVADLSAESLQRLARTTKIKETTTDVNSLFQRADIDALVIATPVHTHADLARAALLAGKHVLVEKPLTDSAASAAELIALAQTQQRVLLVDHTFIYTAAVQKMQELIQQGEIGEVLYIDSARVNLGLIQPDVSVHWDLAPHDISIFQKLLGADPVAVSATGSSHVTSQSKNPRYEVVHLSIVYPHNVIAHIQVSWLSPVKLRQMVVAGSKKAIVFNDIEPSEKIRVYDRSVQLDFSAEQPAMPFYRSGDLVIPFLNDREALRQEAEHFIRCIRDGEKPITSGADGLTVVKILAAADQSLKQGGAFIPINS